MSLFRASNAPADNHHDTSWSMPVYDGPTERLAEPEPPAEQQDEPDEIEHRPRRGGVVPAVVFSGLALLISAGAAVIAWDAQQLEPRTIPALPVTPVASIAPSVESSTGGYQVSYAQEPLRMQVGCAASMYIDLDEPRADAEPARSDLRYDSQCGGKGKPTLSLGPGADGGSQVSGSDTDAAGCDKAIRTSPLGSGADVPADVGTVLCVLSSASEARERGERPRMALVEVVEVDPDGTAGLRATSWTVP